VVRVTNFTQKPAAGALQTFTAKMAQQGFFIKDRIPAMRTLIPLHKSWLLSHQQKNNQEKIL